MVSAGMLFFIRFFLFFPQGISPAITAIILYAVLSHLPLPSAGPHCSPPDAITGITYIVLTSAWFLILCGIRR